jgi:hypothetical protein
VLGIPLAMSQWSYVGLILGTGAVLQGALLLVILSACSLEQAGVPKREIVRAVSGLLSPFAAPRAAEVVAETTLTGAAPLEALRLLLPGGAYSEVLRPLAYDVRHRGLDRAILANVPKRVIENVLKHPAGSNGSPYCPRCARTYTSVASVCRDCDGLALTP